MRGTRQGQHLPQGALRDLEQTLLLLLTHHRGFFTTDHIHSQEPAHPTWVNHILATQGLNMTFIFHLRQQSKVKSHCSCFSAVNKILNIPFIHSLRTHHINSSLTAFGSLIHTSPKPIHCFSPLQPWCRPDTTSAYQQPQKPTSSSLPS